MVDWTELLNPINILDIAIVAILIYKLITIVKGTRAVQLIKGILLLLVLSVISRVLQLTTVNWILTQVQTMLLVAIPIVFQPELRRALEQIGKVLMVLLVHIFVCIIIYTVKLTRKSMPPCYFSTYLLESNIFP